ncbi:hypothetical protein ACE6H2_000211 [Prunus campanulata]
MAASSSMQSIFLANSVAYGAGKNKCVGVISVPAMHRYSSMRVRSMAKPKRPIDREGEFCLLVIKYSWPCEASVLLLK